LLAASISFIPFLLFKKPPCRQRPDYSIAVYISNSSPSLLRLPTGSFVLICTPGPTLLVPLLQFGNTFVPPHPHRNATSLANNSPNPSISPFTNGKSRLIAAPLSNPHIVGGWYSIKGLEALEDAGAPPSAESDEDSLLAS